MKTVSQLNSQGYFIGSAVADESPLEPGVFLLPGGCVDVEPIAVPAGKLARFDGAAFVLESMPTTPELELAPPPTPDQIIATKKQAVRAVRKLILDILTGIATEANLTGDVETTNAYLVVLRGLKDITEDWPADPALVDALVMQRYAALVAQCTPQMVSAFAQVAA